MVTTNNNDLPKKSLHIKEDDKFFSRLLSKETSVTKGNSFRVYYGGASGSVPFTWESQPGTPKNPICDHYNLPPLTPPPSFYSISENKPGRKSSKSLLHTLFPKLSLRRTHSAQSSTLASYLSPSSSSSSCSSTPRTTPSSFLRRSRFSCPGSSFDYTVGDEHSALSSPSKNLCFGVALRKSRSRKVRGGCYPWRL
ncbi:hypothetical protein GIB67_008065 [Kingdonia uniflora]|uniref:Uncharacterized protein n=1 Tax=Kingdonia uniflora TaxID=39325 RepID=A0A7J7MD13_9MAGN|nr:hypothetical protein GIB67_008065 [Kingdonia uniflora]